MTRARLFAVAGLALAALAPMAGAHAGDLGGAAETRFEVPLWLVWLAGGFVIAASFAVVGGHLSRGERSLYGGPDPRQAATLPPRRTGLTPARVLGLAVLVLAMLPALYGDSDATLPAFLLWTVVVGLLPLLAYTIGDLFRVVSPFEALRRFTVTLRGGRDPSPYPQRLGAWPAVFGLVTLVALEVAPVAWTHRATPLALLFLGYTLITLIGMARYGADRWLADAEVVTRAMRWWRAASPIDWQRGRPTWRGFRAALEGLPVHRSSDVAFTVAVLYAVNFDAFLTTHPGDALLFWLDRAGLGALGATLVLAFAGFALFFAVWTWAARRIRRAARTLVSPAHLCARFAAVLLPIAVAYHLAHHIPTLIENAPLVIPALVDPLGLPGWPAASLRPAPLSLPASAGPFIAAFQVTAVLLGHVLAVLVAHRLAFRTFPSRVQAVRGEVPLTAVMVGYTSLGLWLLSAAGGAA